MKKLISIYIFVFLVILFIVSRYNNIMFKFSDVLQMKNLLVAFVSTGGLLSLHLFILKKKSYLLFLSVLSAILLWLGNEMIFTSFADLAEFSAPCLLISLLITMTCYIIYSLTPQGNKAIEENLEKSLGGLVFGVAGAVVGGMSGMGTTKEMKTEHFIKVTCNNNIEFLLAPFMNNPENYKYLTRKFNEYKEQIKL